MFHSALPRGRGPAFADLPPTLRPHAVTAAAPSSDHARSAALSALVYVLLGGGALAFSSSRPAVVPVPIRPTRPEYVIEIDRPPMPRPVESGPGSLRGPASGPAPFVTNPVVPIPEDPLPTGAGLPTEDHHLDAGLSGTGPSTGNLGVDQAAGAGIQDFSSVGLAVLHRVDPLYPEFARKAQIQGPVVLLMTVDERGQPIRVQVLEGHPAFHVSALQAARQWRFEPARMNGQVVAANFKLTLNFRLQ